MSTLRSGRGFFSNWFLTEKERDLRDLQARHDAFHCWFESCPLSGDDALVDTACRVVVDIHNETQSELNLSLARAIYKPIEELLEAEFFAPPRVDAPDWGHLDLSQRASLRQSLSRWSRLQTDWGAPLNLGCNKLFRIGQMLLLQASRIPNDSAEHGPVKFDTALVDLLDDPALRIENVMSVIFETELERAQIFNSTRAQLRRNLYTASGATDARSLGQRQLVTPTRSKNQSPAYLVDTYLGGTQLAAFLEAPLPIQIPDAARFEHAHILGGTGHGKTQLLQYLIAHDLHVEEEDAPSVIVIDSQGDLIRTIVQLAIFDPGAAPGMAERLVLIDPNDIEYPTALNMFAVDQERIDGYELADRERVLNSVVDLFDYIFSALLGAELTQKQGVVFKYLARLMMVIPNATVQTLRELMEDGRPFKPYMEKLDGSARRFFETEFFSSGFAATKKQILRRLWGVLATPAFERMFSHPQNRIDMFEAMNTGKIVLINTAKDLLKPEGSSIFGRFFIAKIAQAALERATLPEDERRATFVYIDEAHDYFDETIEHLFNQARKYRVGLTIAHQNLDQLSSGLRASVMASTSLKFAGGVSARDARALADDMRTDADFIRSMRKRSGQSEFAAYVKNHTPRALRINVPLGHLESQPQLGPDQQTALIDANRVRYCSPLDEVKAYIDASTAPSVKVGETAESAPVCVPDPAPPTVPPASAPKCSPEEAGTVSPPPMTDPADLPPREDPYVEGLGGRQHKYLQQFVRGLAHDHGFKVTVEKPVKSGRGSVDVAVEHEKLSIAVEVSITTELDQEVHNVEKCFAAGFDWVVLLVPDRRKRARFLRDVAERLAEDKRERFQVFGPEDIDGFLIERAAELQASERTVRGYRVRTVYKASSPEDAKRRRDMINRTIAKSILKNRKG